MDETGHETEPHTSYEPRIALANPAGELLWRISPPGTWPAHHPFEARTWADLGEFAAWRREQAEDFQQRLKGESWRPILVVLSVRAVPVRVETEVA